VPLVTIDTSVALPAALAAGSHPRKLWVVLAYGALTYQAEHLRLDRELLAETAANEGGEVRAVSAFDELIESAERRRAVLAELLPYETSDDYVAVGFTALFDEFERKVRAIGRKLDPSLEPEDAAKFRRQFEAICAVGPAPFDSGEAPALTRDPKDDPIVYGALLAGSDFLVSDDRQHIVPDGVDREYEHGEHRLRAMTFGRFVHECFEPADFPWREVDGAWLREAFRRAGA
jgi:predicted nucleic acid-binding protein